MTHEDRLAAAGMTPAELAAWVTDSRARQGLPPTVEDSEALDRMAALVAREDVGSARGPAPIGRG